MIRSIFVLLFTLSLMLKLNAQLTSNLKSFDAGQVNEMAGCTIQIPVLNQSHEPLTYFLSQGSNGAILPISNNLIPYDLDIFTFSPTYSDNKNKFKHEIIFESSEGKIVVNIKGKYLNNSGNQDCYEFDSKKIKVKTSKKITAGTMRTPLVRIYNNHDKNTLYTSNPKKVPYAHLVILIDASGSMGGDGKLSKMKENLFALIDQLRPTDYISIVMYNEHSDVLLDKVSCSEIDLIENTISEIEAGGFTNGKIGIETALEHAKNRQTSGYSNHVIMFTDGAFNFGTEYEGIRRYLLGFDRVMQYKLSVITIGSDNENAKEMKDLTKNGSGYYFNLDKKNDKMEMNKILIKQLSI